MKGETLNSPLTDILLEMAKYKEYIIILDTPGLAFYFNDFINKSLALEKLVLDHFEYKDKKSQERQNRRNGVSNDPE